VHPDVRVQPVNDMATALLEAKEVMAGAVAELLAKTGQWGRRGGFSVFRVRPKPLKRSLDQLLACVPSLTTAPLQLPTLLLLRPSSRCSVGVQ
jgi:hypothetical protein